MSAQAGIWNFDGKPVDEAFLDKLTSAIEQYGPDGGNTYVSGSTGMTYRAFHTTLESRLERQPYVTDRGNVITWDGRLDNRDELMPQLRDELSIDQTDVALFGAAFELWGTDCFRRLIGDWAVSIWRPLERELLFGCDYMAIKHIFYYLKKDHIWWSTDLAPLVLLSSDKFHIDDDYIAGYFAADPDSHLTPYQEIRQVPAGKFARVRDGNVSVQRYWRFSPKSRIRYKTDAEYEEHFRLVFRQSVRRRLRSDSPILAELSGGLDSSSIVCMADEILAKEGVRTPNLETLSYYDKTEPHGDDWIYFQKVEAKRGRVGVHIDASGYGEAGSLEYSGFSHFPGRLGAGRNLDDERAKAMQSGRYRVVLSGLGGDEFTGAIPDPRAHLADLIVQLKVAKLAKQVMAWSLIKRKPWIQLLLHSVAELLPPSLGQYLVKEAKVEPWIEKDFAKRSKLAYRLLCPTENFGLWLPTRRSFVGSIQLMANKMAKLVPPNLALEEARYPYLDQNFIEFILSIPASQLLRPGERRSLMRRSLVMVVPQEILSRRTKQFGARTPMVALEKNWEQLQKTLESPLSQRIAYVNHARFLESVKGARNGKPVHAVRLLRTVSLEFWLRDLVKRGLIDEETTTLRLPTADSLLPKTSSITPASKVVGAS